MPSTRQPDARRRDVAAAAGSCRGGSTALR